MNEFGIKHYKGKQFKYIYFVCDKWEERRLRKECLENISKNYPKEPDLEWKVKTYDNKWIKCGMPPYKTDIDIVTREMVEIIK